MLLGIFCTVACTLPFRKYIIHCSVVHAAQSIMEKPPLAVGDRQSSTRDAEKLYIRLHGAHERLLALALGLVFQLQIWRRSSKL